MMKEILDKIPENGFVMACLEDRLVFSEYRKEDGVLRTDGKDCTELINAEECHFFNGDTEYRRIRRGARGDVIETVLTAQQEQQMDPDLIFAESVLVKPQYAGKGNIPERLTIVNRYRYSEHDTIVLDDYRIAGDVK